MHVVATAGHVDHGKSTLVQRLTGMQPDRWAEERRRGLTIDLGFAWTDVAGVPLAFVDVPGHERFVPNMLAGIGPVASVMFVVAADEGWMAQSEEHLAVLNAFGVRNGLLVVTKSDRADPGPVLRDARDRIAETPLGELPSVAVSGQTGHGIDSLRYELAELVTRLPQPDRTADVRLWIDRAFTVRGAGTVVTGTLQGGTVRVGDELTHSRTKRPVTVRGVQALGMDKEEVEAVARIAVNLRGVDRDVLRRGDALLSPDMWRGTSEIDVAISGRDATTLPSRLVLHIGSASPSILVRPLETHSARISLHTTLPLRVGDIGLLRDPSKRRVAAGFRVLDARPPAIGSHLSATARARELAGDEHAAFLRRYGFVRSGELHALGLRPSGKWVGDWLVDEKLLDELPGRIGSAFEAWTAEQPLAAGMPVEQLRKELNIPDADILVEALAETEFIAEEGQVRRPGTVGTLPREVDTAIRELERGFATAPFHAPEADDLRRLGLGRTECAAAVRAGRLTLIADGVVLGPNALAEASSELATLPSPFTVSQARRALDTTRRVVVPLLERLDRRGTTERLDNGHRRLRT